MAQKMLRLKHEYSLLIVGLLNALLLIQESNGFEFKVGGTGSWSVPSDPNAAMYANWAEKNRFQIGDTLLFVYPANQDSVLHVTKEDYTNCTTSSPLDKFTDGHTVFKFNQSGPHYFLSGVEEHCHKNEKLVVVVMADRNHHNNSINETVSSPPSPSPEVATPSLAPALAPAGEQSPSPPQITPTPPPSNESPPHKNAAASSIIGNIKAAIVGLILLVLAI